MPITYAANDLHFIAARLCNRVQQRLFDSGYLTHVYSGKSCEFADPVKITLDIPQIGEYDYDLAFLRVINPLTFLFSTTVESRAFRSFDVLDREGEKNVVCQSRRLCFRLSETSTGHWFWKKTQIHLEFVGRK